MCVPQSGDDAGGVEQVTCEIHTLARGAGCCRLSKLKAHVRMKVRRQNSMREALVIAERRPEVFIWGSNCQLTDGLI